MEAKPKGSPRRVGHGIASPKGAAKKEVHTSRPQVAGRHSNTVNREAPPTRSSRIRSSEPQWNRTQGQLKSCLSCQPQEDQMANDEHPWTPPSGYRPTEHQPPRVLRFSACCCGLCVYVCVCVCVGGWVGVKCGAVSSGPSSPSVPSQVPGPEIP